MRQKADLKKYQPFYKSLQLTTPKFIYFFNDAAPKKPVGFQCLGMFFLSTVYFFACKGIDVDVTGIKYSI